MKMKINIIQKDIVVIHAKDVHLMEKLYKLYTIPQMKQKSKEWLEQRNNYLTASTIKHAISGSKKNSNRLNLLANKVSKGDMYKFSGNLATEWGNKYEPVANALYSYRNNNVVIHEFGLIPCDDKRLPFLAASPDGITSHGRMIEIKCPYSRIIDGKIKDEYYHQMQQQMLVCDFEICDFLECTIKEISKEIFWEDFDHHLENHIVNGMQPEQGIIISFIRYLYDYDDPLYPHGKEKGYEIDRFYSPIKFHNNKEEILKWEKDMIEKLNNNNESDEDEKTIYLKTSYWRLKVYNCQEVKRDTKWIEEHIENLTDFWNEIIEYRKLDIDEFKKIDEITRQNSPRQRNTPSPESVLYLNEQKPCQI